MNGEKQFKRIISGESKGVLPDTARLVLSGLSGLYGAVVNDRNGMYNRRATDPRIVVDVDVPVISIGNITVGGTGKTPMVSYVCSYFLKKGMKPVVLSRGYKAKDNKISTIVSDGTNILVTPEESGDEAYLLAKKLPGCAVVIGRSRIQSAQIAVEQLKADVLVMDDGFQHRKLNRDLDIVLLDATNPFGYENVLPRGLLREPLSGLNRADLVILTKTDQVESVDLTAIEERLRRLAPQLRWVSSVHNPQTPLLLRDWKNGSVSQDNFLPEGQPLLAVSAIGNPASFTKTIHSAGYTVIDELSFRDHHNYSDKDVLFILAKANATGVKGIVITEKDAVKLMKFDQAVDSAIPFYVLPIGITITENDDFLENALAAYGKEKI